MMNNFYLAENAYRDTPSNIRQRVSISQPNLLNDPTAAIGEGMQPLGLHRYPAGVSFDIPSDTYNPRASRLKINASPMYYEGTPTIKMKGHKRYTMLSGVKGSNRENQITGYAVREARDARRRRSGMLKGVNTKQAIRRTSTLTPFKQSMRTMDYGRVTNKSIASPMSATKFSV